MRSLLFGLLLAGATALHAADIRVLSSTALKSTLEVIGPQFEKESGHRILLTFAPAAELKKRIENGETFDITVLTTPLMDDLARQSMIAVSSRFNLARAGAGVAIRKGAPKPDLSTTDAFKRALLSAKSVAYVGTGATAANIQGVFQRMDIADQMKAKTKLLSGMGAAEAVAKGEAELGFTQVSEIMGVEGAELAGPLPAEIQVYTVFPAAGGASAPSPIAALEFLRYLRTPEAAKVIRAKGMEPG